MTQIITQTAAQLAHLVASGEVSAREVVDAHLERIAEVDGDPAAPGPGDVHAFLHLTADAARAHADDIDARRSRGDVLGPLAGVPLALKDVMVTRGVPTTCGAAASSSSRSSGGIGSSGRRMLRSG